MELDLIENMTSSVRAEVFYDVNKFIMDQVMAVAMAQRLAMSPLD